MKNLSTFTVAIAVSLATTTTTAQSCLPVETVENFDLEQFIRKPWYVQQQAENAYTSIEFNQCVTAQYVQKGYKTFWGYDIGVYNVAAELNNEGTVNTNNPMVGSLCAKADDIARGKLKVAPCFLPSWFAGPYWIVAYDDEEMGYALISGGQPNNVAEGDVTCGENADAQCCTTGEGVNNSGLWIFTRDQNPSQALVDSVRGIAKKKGFSTTVLFDVEHPAECSEIVPEIVPPSSNRRALRQPTTIQSSS